jgi:hypothetical protein
VAQRGGQPFLPFYFHRQALFHRHIITSFIQQYKTLITSVIKLIVEESSCECGMITGYARMYSQHESLFKNEHTLIGPSSTRLSEQQENYCGITCSNNNY